MFSFKRKQQLYTLQQPYDDKSGISFESFVDRLQPIANVIRHKYYIQDTRLPLIANVIKP